MMNKAECCLCNVISGVSRYGIVDRPLMENDHYIAIASIGAFIEGWTMIVPKAHQLSLASNYQDKEFLTFLSKVQRRIVSRYGDTIMFEHGANKNDSLTGCGVDHAHFHIVPHAKSLKSNIYNSQLPWQGYTEHARNNLIESESYLFYSDGIANGFKNSHYCIPPYETSQYFRSILASELDIPDKADYKRYLFIENSKKTYYTLMK